MAIIDPDGLFNGERLQDLSDVARLWWPYMFLYANGFGRFEVNFRRVRKVIFSTFTNPPDEQQFITLINEYSENHLLFLYDEDGRTWGQWDCKPGCLPRYKTNSDRNSPIPPANEFDQWKKARRLKTKPFPKPSVNLPKVSVGVGIGIGIGVGEERRKTARANPDPEVLAWFTMAFWPTYPRHTAKAAAAKAALKKAATPELRDTIMEGLKRQVPGMVANPEYIPHASTWLNGERWNDEPQMTLAATNGRPVDRFERHAQKVSETFRELVGGRLQNAQ